MPTRLVVFVGAVTAVLAAVLWLSSQRNDEPSGPSTGSERGTGRGGPQPGPSSQEPVMHRVQAGTPDETGWYLAQSTNGGFSVELPAPFNDFDVGPTEGMNPWTAAQAVGTQTAGLKFAALRFRPREDTPALSQARKDVRGLGRVILDRDVTYGDYPGFEVHITTKTAAFAMRAYEFPNYRYVLSVENTRGLELDEGMLKRFFGSLKVADDSH